MHTVHTLSCLSCHLVLCSVSFKTWWRNAMETLSALLDLCEGNPPVTGGFPSQRALMFCLAFACTKSWINCQVAAELKRHGTHCDVIVMIQAYFTVTGVVTRLPQYQRIKLEVSWWRHGMKSLFRVDSPSWGKSPGHRWIPPTTDQ